MYIILVHISSQHVSCILKPLHLSHWREMLRVQTYRTRHGNVTRNLSYARIMSRLNCSAISYVQLEKKLPSVILPQLTCKTLLENIYRVKRQVNDTKLSWMIRQESPWEMRNVEYKCSILLNKEARICALFRCHCPCRSLDFYLNRRRIHTRASSWNMNQKTRISNKHRKTTH